MREDVTLEYGGQVFSGWNEFSFSAAIDSTASSFSFTTTRSPLALIPPSVASEDIQVRANGDLLVTGYAEKYNGQLSREGGRVLTISGRSKTSSLVDSDATGHFRSMNGLQIIKQLVADFDVEIETNILNWATLPTFTVESGLKVKDAIFHVMRMQQATVSVTPDGKLRLWQESDSQSQGAVSTANYILGASLEIDETKRFSEYIAKGQDSAKFESVQASEIIGKARDETSRFRRRIFFPEPEVTTPSLRASATKVAERSFGLARSLNLELNGWRDESGAFWSPGNKLLVDLEEYDLHQEMLIQSVTLKKSRERGTLASLAMKPLESVGGTAKKTARKSRSGTSPSRSSSGAATAGDPGIHTTVITGG